MTALDALEVSGELHVLAGLGYDAGLAEVKDVFDELWGELDDGAVGEHRPGIADGADLGPREAIGHVALRSLKVQGEVDVPAGLSHDASFSNLHDVVHELASEGDDAAVDRDDATATDRTHTFPGEANGTGGCDSHHRRYYNLQNYK